MPDKGVLGKTFRREAKVVMEWLAALSETSVVELETTMTEKGCVYGELS